MKKIYKKQAKIIAVIICICVIIIVLLKQISNTKNYSISRYETVTRVEISKEEYDAMCIDLYRTILSPNESLIFNPPLKTPPEELLDDFTQHGDMPISKYYYLNDINTDNNANNNVIVKKTQIQDIMKKIKENKALKYSDKSLNELMNQFAPSIKNKTLVVVGATSPWIEFIGLYVKASRVLTLGNTRFSYENEKLEWLHINDYLQNAIDDEKFEQFDNAISFSSIEHIGLGRYGDALNPNGDIEAIRQVHCMLKQGGLFILALPTSRDGSSFIEFNAHRVYGSKRLDLLFDGWRLLMARKDSIGVHTIFVLQKY